MSDKPPKISEAADKLTAALEHARDALGDRMLELGQKKSGPGDEITYNVVFTGQLTLPESQAIANLAGFFKTGADSTRRLLQAGRVLKAYPSKAQADKLASLLRRAGAECKVEMEAPPEEEPTAVQKAAFALKGAKIPAIRLPDYRKLSRQHWIVLGVAGIAILATILWFCLSAPTIHGETAAEYEASVERMVNHAAPEQQYAVRQAIALLTEVNRKTQGDSATTSPDAAARLIYAPVKGKKAEELVALAEARLEKQRNGYRQGIAAADQKIAEARQQLADITLGNKQVLDKIEVTSAALGWPPNASSPTLVFAIHNNSSEALMHVYLQGYLYDENGALLLSNPLTYSIASGIEPGGVINTALPTQSDSLWTAAPHGKNGLTLKIRVANAENRQGKALGTDYRPMEAEIQRQSEWKAKVQKQLDAVKL